MPEVTTPERNNNDSSFPILVHCHLNWDWVWQRPQQFMSRLARRHPVLFVETHAPSPAISEARAAMRKSSVDNVNLLQVQFPLDQWQDGRFVDRERRRLVQEAIDSLLPRFHRPVQWFYDPMAVTAFAGHMNERLNVYDCMDELSKFRGAPPEIIERERALLRVADVVFTGGRKMWESKSPHNDNCHFYGCGVDVEHFGSVRADGAPVADDIASIPAPRLGYVGVVDERMDYGLVRQAAEARPDWHFVFVGPVCKVDEADLPRRPNIHWVGGRKYEELPRYLAGFDVCLMPFALNESTEYINPTKALEYLATGLPVVSTPVADVVRNFGEAVAIAESPGQFVIECERALTLPDPERRDRGLEMAAQQTWERIVDALEGHVLDALAQKGTMRDDAGAGVSPPAPTGVRGTSLAARKG